MILAQPTHATDPLLPHPPRDRPAKTQLDTDEFLKFMSEEYPSDEEMDLEQELELEQEGSALGLAEPDTPDDQNLSDVAVQSGKESREREPAVEVVPSQADTSNIPDAEPWEFMHPPASSSAPRVSKTNGENDRLNSDDANLASPAKADLNLDQGGTTPPISPNTNAGSTDVDQAIPVASPLQKSVIPLPDGSRGLEPDDGQTSVKTDTNVPAATTDTQTQGAHLPTDVTNKMAGMGPFQFAREEILNLTGDDALAIEKPTESAGAVSATSSHASSAIAAATGTVKTATPTVVQQIAAALTQSGGQSTQIALNPEELGRVRISLSSSESGLVVHIMAERSETADLMRRNIDSLLKDFSDLGYENPSFDFQQGGQQSGDDTSSAHSQPPSSPRAEVTIAAHDVPQRNVTAQGGLDLKL